jgi:hypothetical protein
VINRENRRDFEDRGQRNVRLQVVNANFDPDKHRQAEEWIDEREHVFERERNALARSANTRATIALVISAIAALAAIVPLVILWHLM